MTDFPSFSASDDEQIVYVRNVKTADLPDEVRAQTGGQDTVYAIHAESGEVLALVSDRKQAFILARRNEMLPHSVH
ncbi:DUF1150 family protein [Amaricoccus macauensis]|uniref:DUF1150 family protein n=1 Tax=Amaricoccus macauensis TaxID=57001 RepID=UPI003C7C88F9